MLSESQNIEYKESWRDEYLKWICGFANAQGGNIFIGVNDEKQVIGLPDAKKLMEDIPNKIVNYLGIVEDVNLLTEGKKEYIEIGRTRQTLWRAVQMLTQKLCCQTIHDCPKVVPLHYESEWQ